MCDLLKCSHESRIKLHFFVDSFGKCRTHNLPTYLPCGIYIYYDSVWKIGKFSSVSLRFAFRLLILRLTCDSLSNFADVLIEEIFLFCLFLLGFFEAEVKEKSITQ